MTETTPMPDWQVAEFLDLARSARIEFEIVHDRLHMRMVNPDWAMWKPCRHLLDEIGQERIARFLRARMQDQKAVDRWTALSAERLALAADAMR